MIKFFRKIRQSLLSENKPASPAGRFSKYLIYAIGEIILVVVGILIALSINNANEQRKMKEFEFQLLVELQKTINLEINNLEFGIEKHQESTAACKLLIGLLKENHLPKHDSIPHYFDSAFTVRDINLRYSAFENLKSHGLHFIKDEGIRLGLLSIYEGTTPFYETLYNRYDMYYYNTIAPEIAENYIYVNLGPNRSKGFFPNNISADSDNNKHINMLTKTSELVRRILNVEFRLIKRFKKLDELLTDEIKNNQ